MVAVEETY